MEASLVQVPARPCLGCFRKDRSQPQMKKQWGHAHLPKRHNRSSMHLREIDRHFLSPEVNSALKISENKPSRSWKKQAKSDTSAEAFDKNVDIDLSPREEVSVPKKRTAKIHDFCLGIPFGGIVFCGGIIGYIFSRNLASLSTGLLFGGALLSLSCFSLKIWKHGLSSLPFILGQGAIAAVLFWKHFQAYSLTKKIFPAGFFLLLSGGMFCFYSYVLLSGGNPPPKKLAAKAS